MTATSLSHQGWGHPTPPTPERGHVPTGRRERRWPVPASGCIQPPALHPWRCIPPSGRAGPHQSVSAQLPEKNSLLARDVFWRPDQTRQSPGPSVAEPGEVTAPGGVAGARPEPPEEGTKPGPARVALSLLLEKIPGNLKREGRRRSGENKPEFLLPPCLAAHRERGHFRGGSGAHPAVGMSRLGRHRRARLGCWKGCRTWTRPPVTRGDVEISCLRPRCFSRAALEQKTCFIRKKNPP